MKGLACGAKQLRGTYIGVQHQLNRDSETSFLPSGTLLLDMLQMFMQTILILFTKNASMVSLSQEIGFCMVSAFVQ